jgi:hypothetical protein
MFAKDLHGYSERLTPIHSTVSWALDSKRGRSSSLYSTRVFLVSIFALTSTVLHHAHVFSSFAALFSLFLTPDKVGGAELTLGGIDTSKFSGTPTFLPVVGAGSFWELTSSKVSVNGKTNSALQGSMGIIFDSGTSNLVFPQDIAEVSPRIRYRR